MKNFKLELTLKVYDDDYNLVDVVDLSHIHARLSPNRDFKGLDGADGNIEIYAPLDKELYQELEEYINSKE